MEYVPSFESNKTSTSEIMHNVSSETKTSNDKTEQVMNKKSNKIKTRLKSMLNNKNASIPPVSTIEQEPIDLSKLLSLCEQVVAASETPRKDIESASF